MLKGIRAVMRDLHQIPFISLYKVCVVLSLITFSLPDYALLQRSAPRKLQPIFWNSQLRLEHYFQHLSQTTHKKGRIFVLAPSALAQSQTVYFFNSL